MTGLRIVYMGTPDFAVPALQELIKGPYEITGVFCQPDKEKGRGKKVQMPPVKEAALQAGLPVYQPVSLKGMESLFSELAPDLIVVAAYGKILPKWLLDMPRYGCINIHASLLPAYRGAAPIHQAILNGDKETGITIMKMAEGLDTGDILQSVRVSVGEEETTGELFDRLALLGGEVIGQTVEELINGRLTAVPQNEAQATYTAKITKDMGRINWQDSALVIARQIRGLAPSPGCFTFLDGRRLKIWKAQVIKDGVGQEAVQDTSLAASTASRIASAVPGTITKITDKGFVVQTGEGGLEITEVQPENKKRMSAGDFQRGHNIAVGMVFTKEICYEENDHS